MSIGDQPTAMLTADEIPWNGVGVIAPRPCPTLDVSLSDRTLAADLIVEQLASDVVGLEQTCHTLATLAADLAWELHLARSMAGDQLRQRIASDAALARYRRVTARRPIARAALAEQALVAVG